MAFEVWVVGVINIKCKTCSYLTESKGGTVYEWQDKNLLLNPCLVCKKVTIQEICK